MGTWFIGAREITGVYAAKDVMKSWPAECDDEVKDSWVAFLKANGRWKEGVTEAIPHDAIWFDGGGTISTKEPLVSWEANGCKMKTYVRHLPFVLAAFRGLKPVVALPGIVGLGGFCRKYFLSPKTASDSIETMERLLRGTESLRQELEADLQRVFNEIPGQASARKCGCMSGLMYGDCCGKFIETQEHRDNRKVITGSQ